MLGRGRGQETWQGTAEVQHCHLLPPRSSSPESKRGFGPHSGIKRRKAGPAKRRQNVFSG